MEKLAFGDFPNWTKLIMFNCIFVVGLFGTFVNYLSLRTKVYTLVFFIKLMDRVDVLLQRTGIKMMRLTRERIMDSLTEEERAEINSEDLSVPLDKYIQVRFPILIQWYIFPVL